MSLIIKAYQIDALVSSADYNTSVRADNCSSILVRLHTVHGVLDFRTHCSGSSYNWFQRIKLLDWADLDREELEKINTFQEAKEKFPEIKNMDVEVSCGCLTGDTKIPLLDGRTLTMEEIYKEYGYKSNFWVYSCDEKGDFKPGKARSLGVTKKVKEIYEVTLDNGRVIKCTEEHPFMMRDGTYKEAKALLNGDSLMPLLAIVCTVVSVKKVPLNTETDVYDLNVEKWENYLTDAGVFVHNCPAFVYRGSSFILHTLESDEETLQRYNNEPIPETRPPDKNDPYREHTLCKHLVSVIKKFML